MTAQVTTQTYANGFFIVAIIAAVLLIGVAEGASGGRRRSVR